MTGEDWRTLLFTAGISVLAVALMLAPATLLAWLLARREWRGKTLVETLVALPLVIPPVATGLILLKIFGRRGAVGGWIESALGFEIIFTWRAVLIALAVMAAPMLVKSFRIAIEQVPISLEQAARTLGASPWRVFLAITLPLARRGMMAGVLLAFARALGEFGATMVVAGYMPQKTATISMEIYQAILEGNDERAWRFVAASAGLAFAALWLGERMNKKLAE